MGKRMLICLLATSFIFIFVNPVKSEYGTGWVECEILATQTWDTTRHEYRIAFKLNDINGSFSNTWIQVDGDRNHSHFLAQALTAISAGKNIEVRIVQKQGSYYIDAMRLLN